MIIKKFIGWQFVDKNGKDYFNKVFFDKFSAETYGKLKHCKGKAIRIKVNDIIKIKECVKE